MEGEVTRCGWAGEDVAEVAYHDEEWGVPLSDDVALFACLTLEGAQAGLSWSTILARREGYRAAFWRWDLERIAAASDADRETLRGDVRIIRNRLKIAATVDNAAATLALLRSGTLAHGTRLGLRGTQRTASASRGDVQAQTDGSRALSRELKSLGFRFVGPTICYAFMQASGIVNDHLVHCFRHDPVEALRRPLLDRAIR